MCTALCLVWITGQITFYLIVKYVTIALVKKNKNSFHLIDSICLYPVKLTYSYSLFIHLLHLKRGLCAHLQIFFLALLHIRKLRSDIQLTQNIHYSHHTALINPRVPFTYKFKHVNMNLVQPCHRFVTVWQFPVIEFIEQACVNRRKLLRRQIDLVKPFSGPVEQQPSSSAGDGGGVFGAGQRSELHPLAPQALVLAETDGARARPEAADDVHVRLPESPRLGVLLPDGQDRPEFGLDARLLKNLSDCGVSYTAHRCADQWDHICGSLVSKGFQFKERHLKVQKQNLTLSKGSSLDKRCLLDL